MDDGHEFVGREAELGRLNRLLDQVRRTRRGLLVSVRGRRRVGKSRLVEEFIRKAGAPAIFYTAVQGPGPVELQRFIETVAQSDVPAAADVRQGASASSWEAALTLAARGATGAAPVVVIIDEFPYLVGKEPHIEAVLQLLWDRAFQRLPVLVILIGSDRTTMEALTEQGRPLYDRVRELVIQPLSPATVARMLGVSAADALDAYTVIGGFPVLAQEWGRRRSLQQYLDEALADPGSFLVISAERALAAEFPTDVQARAVLTAIGSDARAHKTLLDRTGLPQASLDRSLQVLLEKGVVQRLTPYSAKPAPKIRQYVVADPYLRFWLRFVGHEMDTIDRGRGDLVVATVLRDFATFRGRAIEPTIRDAIEMLLPDERFGEARNVGAYWNRNNSIEVDLVGGDKSPVPRRIAFVGSIKWGEGRTFMRADTATLASQRLAVPGADATSRLVGVSRHGFEGRSGLDVQLGPTEILAAHRARAGQ